jgi:hypothetical protein
LNINFEYKIIIKKNDNENLLTLDIEKEGTKTSLNNLYSPNNDSGICEIIENVSLVSSISQLNNKGTQAQIYLVIYI